MPALEAIQKLVENFSTHIEHYKSSGYNETELRREYLDPFWKALGWDIDNEQGYADAYKDVIHEDAIKVGGCPVGPRGGHRGLVPTSNIGHRTLNIERVSFDVRCWTFNVRRSHGPNTLKQLETKITATDPCFALRATQDAVGRSTAWFTNSTNWPTRRSRCSSSRVNDHKGNDEA